MSRNFQLMQRMAVEREVGVERNFPAMIHAQEPGINGHKTRRLPGLDELAREQSLKLVQRLFLQEAQTSTRMVVFAGIDQRNGCSQVCSGAARSLANNVPGSVCVVDANLRFPSLADSFRTPNHYGLTDALRVEGPVRTFAKRLEPENLWLLSSGSFSEESVSLLNSSRVKTRF